MVWIYIFQTEDVGKEILFILQGLPTGLTIKFTWGRLTGEKKNVLLRACRGPIMKLRTQKNDQGRKFLYILDKESANLWGIYRVRKTGVWKL